MEELKVLVGMVAELPSMALWVIGGYFLYKIIIIGSIYGVIKLGMRKLHDVLITKKAPDITRHEWHGIQEITITGNETKRIIEDCLLRTVGKDISIDTDYIHKASANWLMSAILEKEQREAEQKTKENNNG